MTCPPRYADSLSLLKQYYRLFGRLQLYDNTGSEARQIADFLPGGSLLQLVQPPAWAGPVLEHIARVEALCQKACCPVITAPAALAPRAA